jgi:diacylglycerol kinase (ATP)
MKAFIICNPVAGQRDKQDEIRLVVDLLEQNGWQVAGVEFPGSEIDTTALARAAAATDCDAVFVVGGDGTVSRVVDGLVGSDTALAVLPAGTANVLARQLNLPTPGGLRPRVMLDATRLILAGQTRRVDVGRVRLADGVSRHFLCWSGIGFDAEVARTVDAEKAQKRRLGMLAFAIASLRALRDYGGTRTIILLDGKRVRQRVVMLVANNIQLYGAWFKIAAGAVLDDGWLDVYSFRGRHPLRAFVGMGRLLIDRNSRVPQISCYRAKTIEIIPAKPMPVHVDGDTIGYTPATIEVLPRAINLMVPGSAPANLFVDGMGAADPVMLVEWVARLARDAQTALFGNGQSD